MILTDKVKTNLLNSLFGSIKNSTDFISGGGIKSPQSKTVGDNLRSLLYYGLSEADRNNSTNKYRQSLIDMASPYVKNRGIGALENSEINVYSPIGKRLLNEMRTMPEWSGGTTYGAIPKNLDTFKQQINDIFLNNYNFGNLIRDYLLRNKKGSIDLYDGQNSKNYFPHEFAHKMGIYEEPINEKNFLSSYLTIPKDNPIRKQVDDFIVKYYKLNPNINVVKEIYAEMGSKREIPKQVMGYYDWHR